MKEAKVTLHWSLSPSNDVVTQHVSLNVDRVFVETFVLEPVVENVLLGTFKEDTRLDVSVFVKDDAGNNSDAVLASFTVPDLEVPAPVSGVNFTYEVVEV